MTAHQVVAVNQPAVGNELFGVILLPQHCSSHRLIQPTDVEPPQHEELSSHGESVDLCTGATAATTTTTTSRIARMGSPAHDGPPGWGPFWITQPGEDRVGHPLTSTSRSRP